MTIEWLGWAGSALLIYSLLQTRVLRFRVLNLVASIVLVFFNGAIEVWPMVAMNAVIALINLWQIRALLAGQTLGAKYVTLSVGPGSAYLAHLLDIHGRDIARFNPGFDPGQWRQRPGTPLALLIMNGADTVGVVLARQLPQDPTTAAVDLDYVLPHYRDFTPGAVVYRSPGPFADLGVRRVLAPRAMLRAQAYLQRTGFTQQGEDLVLTLR